MGAERVCRFKYGSYFCSAAGVLKDQAASLVLIAQKFTDVQTHSKMFVSRGIISEEWGRPFLQYRIGVAGTVIGNADLYVILAIGHVCLDGGKGIAQGIIYQILCGVK